MEDDEEFEDARSADHPWFVVASGVDLVEDRHYGHVHQRHRDWNLWLEQIIVNVGRNGEWMRKSAFTVGRGWRRNHSRRRRRRKLEIRDRQCGWYDLR